jgi:hypothetical protein
MKVPDNESQPIPPTQHLCGSALKALSGVSFAVGKSDVLGIIAAH